MYHKYRNNLSNGIYENSFKLCVSLNRYHHRRVSCLCNGAPDVFLSVEKSHDGEFGVFV